MKKMKKNDKNSDCLGFKHIFDISRDTLLWVKAVDLMRKLKPKLLVPQHTRPVEGVEKIEEILTAYRDAIQLVHDQTVRYMNKGLHPTQVTNRT